MAQHLESPLLTLPDIARLAQVQRPVVSVWRTRSANTDHPFPSPRGTHAGRELFDAEDVGTWLATTGRGKNPQALADADAFSIRSALADGSARIADGLTGLLTLAALTGAELDALSAANLLAEADDADPEDHFLYRELEALDDDLALAARYARRLIDAAYNPAAAYEQLEVEAARSPEAPSATSLSDDAQALVGAAAAELLATLHPEAALVDPVPGSSELTLAVVRGLPEGREPSVFLADDGGTSARAARRRLLVHGARPLRLLLDAGGQFDVSGAAVVVSHAPATDALEVLTHAENIALQMDDAQRAVVIGPARALSDALMDPNAEALRSELLRGGRVRAVIRLPEGTLPSRVREAQALWVLGPAYAEVPIADRWTMVADLTHQPLDLAVRQDLVSDLAASMLGAEAIRAHAFRFARLVLTRNLLVSRSGLVTGIRRSLPTPNSAQTLLQLEALLADLGTDAMRLLLSEPRPGSSAISPESIQRLIALGHLRYIPGVRLDASIPPSAGGGTRVLSVRELTEPGASPGRLDLLNLVARHPGVRLTEPADVVFCTSPRPAALVDCEGGAVVPYPARVLRINTGDPGGLTPRLVASDINVLGNKDRAWRRWRVRRVSEAQLRPLAEALEAVARAWSETQRRLEILTQLNDFLANAVADGVLVLDPTAQKEGTR